MRSEPARPRGGDRDQRRHALEVTPNAGEPAVRVAELKQQVAAGTYLVDMRALAEKLLDVV